MRIGIFDSGIGGVNVLKELLNKYPNNYYIYYGDTLNLPYGDRSKEELLVLAENIMKFLIMKKVDIVIIACGTISSTCYNELKSKYHIPIYDIITPTINYMKNSSYDIFGVIGTTRTIESKIFNVINKKILSKATPDFVPIIENNIWKKRKNIICSNLSILKNNIDALVLGCTHYPLLKKEISEYLRVPLIDMGVCLLNSIKLTNDGFPKIDLFFSRLDKKIENNVNNILKNYYVLPNKNNIIKITEI